ncbi:hypothetical protein LXG23DRAFT_50865 [Yarrowia lipolytica]|uniref:Uncharacterized protein n=1 Tax=Yarrowia lipolytica TaxID=4952 RepID=A0A1D8N3B7_YARLL|nr:hypothetical protein YALI1_A01670g [Yarrowia lipolytica]KAJ8051262.1 hypothetical protein LXG23DRAFT_50865 [Yarrowia lipolytica]RMI96924.1 hypothetical protein BD777DRAFT_142035 [Yarrowia lipolytica]
MSVIISYQGTHLDLPYAPAEESHDDDDDDGDDHGSPSSNTTGLDALSKTTISLSRSDSPLPSFEQVMHEQRSLMVDFTPIVTVKYTKSMRVKKMTAALVRHMIVSETRTQTNETLVQWDLFSGRCKPVEGPISEIASPVSIQTSTHKYPLHCTLPAGLHETASHNSSKLWYTLETQVSCQKRLHSNCGLFDYCQEIVIARDRQMNDQALLPVNVSTPWLKKLRFVVSYPQKVIVLNEDTEIPVKITTTLFEKPIRLNTVNISVTQTCNSNANDAQKTRLLTVNSNRYTDSDELEHDEIELQQAREEGFDVKKNFFDSIHRGNLLIPGAEETELDYTLKLNVRIIDKLSASTSRTHPLHIVHKIHVSLRFSQLDMTDQPNQKTRRYVDLSLSAPLVFSRTRRSQPVDACLNLVPFEYEDFLLCEYPRLKNTNMVFKNDYANDSAPLYESLPPPVYEAIDSKWEFKADTRGTTGCMTPGGCVDQSGMRNTTGWWFRRTMY